MRDILEFLKHKNRVIISVVGDFMLDEYYKVTSNRISPEFPIPIMESTDLTPDRVLPGGAGNVAYQFRHFPVTVNLFSIIDKRSEEVLEEHGIRTGCCVPLHFHNNPVKRRIYDHAFPLCRWDIEQEDYGLDNKSLFHAQMGLLEKAAFAGKTDVMILTDYNKGVFSNTTDKHGWLGLGVPITIVDPKTGPLEQWRDCTIFKPNKKEAIEMSGGITDWKAQCNYFQEKLNCHAVVITQSGAGVVCKIGNEFHEYRPQRIVAPESVVGGGDCFTAFLAMALAHGMVTLEAIKVAFEAGTIYVQRKYNQPLHPNELLKHVDPARAKFVDANFLAKRDYKLVFANGVFDLTHRGHIKLLQEAKKFGEKLVVAVNEDDSVKRLKGPSRPIIDCQTRMEVLASLECVDYVVSFGEDTPLELIKAIRPDVLVKGNDHPGTPVGAEFVAEVKLLDTVITSTTSILERVQKVSAIDLAIPTKMVPPQ